MFTSKLTPKECQTWAKIRKTDIAAGHVPKYVYVNPKQQEILNATQKTQVVIIGRGGGKSWAMKLSMLQRANKLKRGRFFIASTSFKQLLTKSLAGLEQTWFELGLVKGKDYVMWRRPPKGWELPYSAPEVWDNCIVMRNGSCFELLSLDRPDLSRGGSYDGGDIDEAALLKREDWTRIILPSLRGNTHLFEDVLHHNVRMYSSIPRKSSGYWLLEYEKMAKAKPKQYAFIEGNAYDNIHVITEDGIERMREEMDYLEFEVEVMNRRIQRAEKAFYHKFDVDKHTYLPNYDYEFDGNGYLVKGCKDVQKDEFLEISFDFGGWFNCCTIWQERDGVEYCVKEFYRKGADTLSELMRDVCKFYVNHKYKMFRIWGEPAGHNPKDNAPTSYATIETVINECGWSSETAVVKGHKTEFQKDRFEHINEIFLEMRRDLPTIRLNYDLTPNLILTLQTTEVKYDNNKDKDNEKERSFPQEKATHLTDTFDYYIMQKYGRVKKEEIRASEIDVL